MVHKIIRKCYDDARRGGWFDLLMHLLSKRALIRMKLLNLGYVINYFASDIDMDSE